ncbi:MAG: YfiR family protein [Candidatus Aminicenantes bacterium]|nr:YfiR family protein [Candidatus Aminicenantes bacterium]
MVAILSAIQNPEQVYAQTASQEYYLGPEKELELLKKILIFERSWKLKAKNQLVIGILYQKSFSLSQWAMEDWIKLMTELPESDRQIDGLPIVIKEIDLDSVQPLESALKELQVNFLYLTPLDLKNKDRLLKNIIYICQRQKVGTLTGTSSYLDSGVAIGFIWKDKKAQITINLEAAKSQGLNFSSQFLRLITLRKSNG